MKIVLTNLVQRIREEFEEAAGLRVTVAEAARFFGLDVEICGKELTELHQSGFLAKSGDGRYQRT